MDAHLIGEEMRLFDGAHVVAGMLRQILVKRCGAALGAPMRKTSVNRPGSFKPDSAERASSGRRLPAPETLSLRDA
jgi:hypothetical protein